MRVIDFKFARDLTIRIVERDLTDDSMVYDVEIIDDDHNIICSVCADSRHDALVRFDSLFEALK
jgi:hypothetical protein